MFKKQLILSAILVLISFSPSVFALDKAQLNLEFFDKFGDEYLSQYINEALINNHSAKQATQRVEQYRQQAKISLGKEFPTLSMGANYLGTHTPNLGSAGGFNVDESAFVMPFIASYEADLLLKNRDKTKSAKKSFEISQEQEKSAYLTLLSDVATVYTNVLQYDELIKLQGETVRIAEDILSANLKKHERGVIDNTALNNSKTTLESTKSRLEELRKQQETLLMQLAVLVGRSSDCADTLKRGSLDTFEYESTLPCEISSEVIFARPDVQAAEKKLEKSKIDVRVARKELFPRFNITGVWAFSTIAGGSFFSWDSSLAALLGGATLDLFKGGQKKANLKLYKAKYEELFENYKQVDLEAVEEVNKALCIVKHDANIDESSQIQLKNIRQNFIDAEKKLDRGVISNPEFWAAQTKLINQEQTTTQSKAQRLVNYFTLYKATGGQL